MIRNVLPETRLADHPLARARIGWLALGVLVLALFVVGQAFLYAELQLPCGGGSCESTPFYLTAAEIAEMRAQGYAINFYAAFQVGLYVIFFLIHAGLATLIFWRGADDRMARFVAFALLIWSGTFPDVPKTLWSAMPAVAALMAIAAMLGGLCFYTFLFIFPNGRFAPRWMRWVVPVLALFGTLGTIDAFPTLSTNALVASVERIRPLFVIAFICAAIGTQLYRYRRVSNPIERQQTRWVLFGIVMGLSWILAFVLYITYIDPALQHGAINKILSNGLIYAGFLLVPLSIGMAILRSRLWNIDLIINRTLVYAALTASVIGLYVLVVGYLGALFQSSGSFLISLVATGVVAVLFQPLRDRLQRGVNRLLYGERDDPYAVLARLDQRLATTIAPDAMLPTIVETVSQALRLPYVAIALDQDEACAIAASVGEPVAGAIRLPLVYQGETIGQLILGPRAHGEGFSPADRRLLASLANHAGAAAHAVRLTSDLQRARERLVLAREEERRRIRRDLHDGIGPQLASQTLTIDAVFRLLPHDTEAALELLRHLKTQSKDAIVDIRRLVYALRPPALDDLGLVAALREQAAQYEQSGVRITIATPEPLPALPAAVEVAVYRIAQEALTNVIRHAAAHTCMIQLTFSDGLDVTIADDGQGLPPDRRVGVGLVSMRERAAELGGRLTIEPRSSGGTLVRAWLPL